MLNELINDAIHQLIKHCICYAVLCQINRQIQGRGEFRSMLHQAVTSSPHQHFRMENGGIVLARESLENNITRSRFQSPFHQRLLDFKARFPR